MDLPGFRLHIEGQLATGRSACPERIVFCFEGVHASDDLIDYHGL